MSRDSLTIQEVNISDLPGIIDFVVRWLEQRGLGRYSFALETAVDEASTNVIKHAYGGKGGFFEITCDLQGEDIVIIIGDRGKPFDPNKVPLPDVDASLEERKAGGLGIYMMKKLMDEVIYCFDKVEGNRLELRKHTVPVAGE
jgi:anti-sigma regulatory factor (Ser/Thr protein kinase)